jgi:hypothetical protein
MVQLIHVDKNALVGAKLRLFTVLVQLHRSECAAQFREGKVQLLNITVYVYFRWLVGNHALDLIESVQWLQCDADCSQQENMCSTRVCI